MGGDEFCVARPRATPKPLEGRAAALTEQGEGFNDLVLYGAVVHARGGGDTDRALRSPTSGCTPTSGRPEDRRARRARTCCCARSPSRAGSARPLQRRRRARRARPRRGSGSPAEDVACIAHAAELHDIGKVAIPDAILDKPARSTPTSGGSSGATR